MPEGPIAAWPVDDDDDDEDDAVALGLDTVSMVDDKEREGTSEEEIWVTQKVAREIMICTGQEKKKRGSPQSI